MNLSRRGMALAALTLLIGAVGQWAPADMSVFDIHASYWWRLPAAALLLLTIIEALSARLFEIPVHWQPAARLQLGHPATIGLVFLNPFPRPITLRAYPRENDAVRFQAKDEQFDLPAGTSHSMTLQALPSALGRCTLPPVPLRLLGRFGLLWWTRSGNAVACEICPDSLHGSEQLQGEQPRGQVATRQRGEGMELLSLREYQPGDGRRHVDWKATARNRRLIVRELAEEQRLELVLVVDAGRASGLHMETRGVAGQTILRLHHYINIAARLGELALGLGDRLSLIAYADDIICEQRCLAQRAGLHRLRHSLQWLAPAAAEANPLSAALAVRRLRQPRSLVIWLTDFDSGDVDALHRAVRILMPRHLPLLGTAVDPALTRLAMRPARNWGDAHASLAALQTEDRLRSSGLRLRRYGADVVSAPPSLLDQAMLARYRELRCSRRLQA